MDGKRMCGLLEVLSSSDSSDNEDLLEVILTSSTRSVKRINSFVETVDSFSEEQFIENFRMKRTTFNELLRLFQNSNHCPANEKGGKPAKTAISHLLAFLWFAGNKAVGRTVALLFDMSLSTFHLVITRVLNFLVELAPRVISFPQTVDEMQRIAEKFEMISGFPNVVGCIDGSYINIKTPKHKAKSTYTNRHDITSLTLQGICDSDKMFLDVFTGVPGKIHDSRVFHLSFIHDTIMQINAAYHLLGDSAYQLSQHILTPYRDYGNLTPIQRRYNLKFCATRVKIENTFGLLKGRFRQLIRTDFHTVERTSKFILACCVLHNLCLINNDVIEIYFNEQNVDNNDVFMPNRSISKQRGELKRDYISSIL